MFNHFFRKKVHSSLCRDNFRFRHHPKVSSIVHRILPEHLKKVIQVLISYGALSEFRDQYYISPGIHLFATKHCHRRGQTLIPLGAFRQGRKRGVIRSSKRKPNQGNYFSDVIRQIRIIYNMAFYTVSLLTLKWQCFMSLKT